jgi:hypothetical protein
MPVILSSSIRPPDPKSSENYLGSGILCKLFTNTAVVLALHIRTVSGARYRYGTLSLLTGSEGAGSNLLHDSSEPGVVDTMRSTLCKQKHTVNSLHFTAGMSGQV